MTDSIWFLLAGGGRKVTRVEVSLDKAKTWLISSIIRHEEPTEHGKHWCWVFWEVEVPIIDLLRADEICSRAVDISNNLQPQKYALTDWSSHQQSPSSLYLHCTWHQSIDMVVQEQLLCDVAMALCQSAVLSSFAWIIASVLSTARTVCMVYSLPRLSGSSAQLWPLPLWFVKLAPIARLAQTA